MRRYIVVQVGARMRYAVPAFLAEADMLASFYTDTVSADHGWLRYLPQRLRPAGVRRLLGRVLPPEIPEARVRTLPSRALFCRALSRPIEPHLVQAVLEDGFGGANALYTVTNADQPLVLAARSAGLHIVHEQVISPEDPQVMREERSRHPGIEPQDPLHYDREFQEFHHVQWRAADRILVPSPFVRDAAIRCGADPRKIALVSYGISCDWLTVASNPVPGRVLFVGTVGLRKGIHYLAAATRILGRRSVPVEVRVVGPLPSGMGGSAAFEGPTYLGQVPYEEVRREYAKADVFVFPTLSDSFGLVQLEAMACGVPVIATPNCGAVVRDRTDGFVVPAGDAEALADKIESVVTNRALRQEMSHNARSRVREFTWDRYKAELLCALA